MLVSTQGPFDTKYHDAQIIELTGCSAISSEVNDIVTEIEKTN